MAIGRHPDLWQYLRRCASILGIVFLSALTTLVVQHLLTPPPVTAQSTGVQEVRASAFVLVGADGTVLGRLASGAAGGGNLMLFDSAGNRRAVVNGGGSFLSFDTDGTTLRFFAGYTTVVGGVGLPPGGVNGVQLGPNGSVGILTGCTAPLSC